MRIAKPLFVAVALISAPLLFVTIRLSSTVNVSVFSVVVVPSTVKLPVMFTSLLNIAPPLTSIPPAEIVCFAAKVFAVSVKATFTKLKAILALPAAPVAAPIVK